MLQSHITLPYLGYIIVSARRMIVYVCCPVDPGSIQGRESLAYYILDMEIHTGKEYARTAYHKILTFSKKGILTRHISQLAKLININYTWYQVPGMYE